MSSESGVSHPPDQSPDNVTRSSGNLRESDIDPAEINKNIQTDASIIGDVKIILRKLNARLDPMNHDEWLSHIERLKDMYPLRYNKEVLTGPYIMEEIYKVTGGDAIICTDVGQHQMWAAQYYKYKRPRQLLTSFQA